MLLGEKIDARIDAPMFMTNYTFRDEDCPWEAVMVEITIPSCLPNALRQRGVAAGVRVTGKESILKAAVRGGIFMLVKNLRFICQQLGVPLPETGSGARGRLTKVDYAPALVKLFCVDGNRKC